MHPNPIYHTAGAAQNLDFARHRGFGVLSVNGTEGPHLAHVPFALSADGKTADLHHKRSHSAAKERGADARLGRRGADGRAYRRSGFVTMRGHVAVVGFWCGDALREPPVLGTGTADTLAGSGPDAGAFGSAQAAFLTTEMCE